ncbi:MAG: hypothetical protein RH862_10000 [Leptospiraceae bacterium]
MRLSVFSGISLILLGLGLPNCIYHSMGKLHYVEMSSEPFQASEASQRYEVQCDNLLDPDGMYSEIREYMVESDIDYLMNFKVSLQPAPEKGALATCIVLEGEEK